MDSPALFDDPVDARTRLGESGAFTMKLTHLSRQWIGVALVLLGGGLFVTSRAIDTQDTRLLSDPALSADLIAFAYANDLWSARLDGSSVRRLTSHPGVESGPHFSPD